jgi:hypothetical protein
VLRNTNKLSGAVEGKRLSSSSNLVRSRICILSFKKTKIVSFYPLVTMMPTSLANPSTSKGEFPEPPLKPNHSSGGELYPSLKAMVRAQPFSGHENENPCHHLRDFEEMCSCLSILGMHKKL